MYLGNINDLLSKDQTTKAAIYKDDRFHVMLLHLPEGDELKPHKSKTDACCIVQKGEVEFILEEEMYHYRKGDLFSFKAGQLHALKAITDFSMLIIK